MRMKPLNTKGFAPLVLLIAAAAVIVVMGGGAYVYHRNHEPKASVSSSTSSTTSTSNKTTASSEVSANDLVNVAKQVYHQVAASGSNPESVGICGAETFANCPFTSDLTSKISNPPQVGPGDGPTLVAGAQNALFGTLTYSDITPTADGGTVTVNLAADTSLGGGSATWNLTMIQDNGKLLVNDITYSRSAGSGTPGCGPIEIYDYTSCPT